VGCWRAVNPQQVASWAGSPAGSSPTAQAERAFALAERLGSVNAAAAELGTTRPSLRKAFTRHGLGTPARNPEAVRQRAIETAHKRSGRPASPSLDPMFVALNHGELPVRARSGGELAERVRRAEDYAVLGARVVVELHTESHAAKPSTRAWAITRRAQRAHRRHQDREQRGERRADRAPRTSRPHPQPQERGWLPTPADPIHPDQLGSEARLRADLVAYPTACWCMAGRPAGRPARSMPSR
jgi:hypothetical protein